MRTEIDFIGKIQIPKNALYGIQSARAKNNFSNNIVFFKEWYSAIGFVKKALFLAYQNFKKELIQKQATLENIKLIEDEKINALIQSCDEVISGKLFEHFIVPAISGGAGTSINFNINEIITNRALQILGYEPGNYDVIHPIEHANVFQSTNDVIPTALKIVIMQKLQELENAISALRIKIEEKEKEYRNVLRIAYTQMQEAVPSSFGILFSNYQEALSRDWWRVSKCSERIKVINLGGGATGTGLAVPKYIIFEASNILRDLVKLPVVRSENMSDATSNLDSFVEVHSILKTNAVNLEKIASDIRLLSSDVVSQPVMHVLAKQIGSTIMPAKVNPVISEYIISSSHLVYANDQVVTSLSAQGCLDLNAYIPTIGHSILQSLNLLISSCNAMDSGLIKGLSIDAEASVKRLYLSPTVTTALIPYIGYNEATELAKYMKENNVDVFIANKKLNLFTEQKIGDILSQKNLLKLGYSIYETKE